MKNDIFDMAAKIVGIKKALAQKCDKNLLIVWFESQM
jgi:hypothetical protein